MATTEKIRKDIEKTREKIAEQQANETQVSATKYFFSASSEFENSDEVIVQEFPKEEIMLPAKT